MKEVKKDKKRQKEVQIVGK